MVGCSISSNNNQDNSKTNSSKIEKNEIESENNAENNNVADIKKFDEENVENDEVDLEVTKDDGRYPDIVVFEYESGTNYVGRQILKSFFEKKGLTYYYRTVTDRTKALIFLTTPKSVREVKIDILMDKEIRANTIDDITDDVLVTTPFRQKTLFDKTTGYYSFVLPIDDQELYNELEEHIKEIMNSDEYVEMFTNNIDEGSPVFIPEGMDWKEYLKQD